MQQYKAWVSVHWPAHDCHAEWPSGCRDFQHPAGIEPMLPTHCNSPWPQSHRFISTYWKKGNMISHMSHMSQPWFLEPIFTRRVLIFGLLKSNIKVRQDIPEFLAANHLSIHIITFNLDWSWIFSLHTFVARSSWAAHNLRSVKT